MNLSPIISLLWSPNFVDYYLYMARVSRINIYINTTWVLLSKMGFSSIVFITIYSEANIKIASTKIASLDTCLGFWYADSWLILVWLRSLTRDLCGGGGGGANRWLFSLGLPWSFLLSSPMAVTWFVNVLTLRGWPNGWYRLAEIRGFNYPLM